MERKLRLSSIASSDIWTWDGLLIECFCDCFQQTGLLQDYCYFSNLEKIELCK